MVFGSRGGQAIVDELALLAGRAQRKPVDLFRLSRRQLTKERQKVKNGLGSRIGEGLRRSLPQTVCRAVCESTERRQPAAVIGSAQAAIEPRSSLDTMAFDLPVNGPPSLRIWRTVCQHLTRSRVIDDGTPDGVPVGLVRRMNARKVIEIGRYKGGSTLTIAAAMNGQGQFWSIDLGKRRRACTSVGTTHLR